MSRSTSLRVLNVCSASVRKSLQGLDYNISSSRAEAFDELGGVAELLGDNLMVKECAKRVKDHFMGKESKRPSQVSKTLFKNGLQGR